VRKLVSVSPRYLWLPKAESKGAGHERLEMGDHVSKLLLHRLDNSLIGIGGLRRRHDGDQG
jgi:hypothetical protein